MNLSGHLILESIIIKIYYIYFEIFSLLSDIVQQ